MGAMTRFEGDKYLARQKVFKMLGNAFYIFRPDGGLQFYVKQKAFKLKEAITVYGDEDMTDVELLIQARSIMDFSGTYDVTTPEGQKVGALRRQGMKSIFRDRWEILDPDDAVIGTVEEDSMALAILRRFLSALVPQSFTVAVGGETVGVFDQHFNPFVAKYDIDFSYDSRGQLDRRLGIAAVVLLLAVEGRQN